MFLANAEPWQARLLSALFMEDRFGSTSTLVGLIDVAAGDKEAEVFGLCPRSMSLLNSFFIGSSPLIAVSESQTGTFVPKSDLAD
jgi:hypothetical protein